MTPLAAIALAITSALTVASTPPPTQPFAAKSWLSSMPKEPTRGARFGSLVVQFEATTLADVMRATSSGTIAHVGDASESVYWLCYTISQSNILATLWVQSHGEMGGPEHVVTGITVKRLRSASPLADCPHLPAGLRPVTFDMPIWIGTNDVDLPKFLGKPSYQRGTWRSYDFERKVHGNCDGGADLMNSLLIKSVRGVVEVIYASQVTSC